jgi:RND superfamily putative drug exporter
MADNAHSSPSGLLERWAKFTAQRPFVVIGVCVAAVAAAVAAASMYGAPLDPDFSAPGTESQRAYDLLAERFPQQAGDSAVIAFRAPAGVNSDPARQQIEDVVEQAKRLPGVTGVSSPFSDDGRSAISADGLIAYATVLYGERASAIPASQVHALTSLAHDASGDGLTAEAGGRVVEESEHAPPGATESIGLLVAAIILLVAFGSLVAAGVPILAALASVGMSLAITGLAARVFGISDAARTIGIMIGAGVGVDYALFILTRFRETLRNGSSVEDGIVESMSTAGRMVLFAGAIVIVAVLGTVASGIPIVTAIGVAGAIFVAAAVFMSLALLPALLALFGDRVNGLRVPFIRDRGGPAEASMWYRLALRIQRHPLRWFGASLALLLFLAAPALDMRLGFADAGNGTTKLNSRRAYDLLSEGFGPGFNGPLVVALDLRDAGADTTGVVARVRATVSERPDVASVSPPALNEAGDAATLVVTPRGSPQDESTKRLVEELRGVSLPAALSGTGASAYVGGPVAAFIDIGDRLTSRLPFALAAVLGVSFVLLMALFRSVLVALKAVAMNLLSMGAAYGVLVVIFQWGWLSGLTGMKEGPIETFVPVLLFSILFGLSMDYEVFLISRIREEYGRTGDNARSVAYGLATTARVIAAAAAIMVAVFLSFALGPQRVIKEFGIGLAVAIFVDATVVRLVLVPATMELLGDANWWLPRWLDRLLPRFGVASAGERLIVKAAAAAPAD